ncbi:MAG: hypothetical protein JKY54_01625, partial [Flavobacteriales bacterium]|nr:hypothetical protein [Flavobacteriales bacterium]
MTFKDFLGKLKTDKKLLMVVIVVIFIVFVFTFQIVSLFLVDTESSQNQELNNNIVNSIPKDSVTNTPEVTKASSYELNKNQNIDKSANIQGMIAGFDTNTDSITKENISRTIAANENSNEIDNRTMSYKEKLLEKQKNYYDRVNKTEHTPNKYSTKTSHKSSRKTKEISLPKEVVTSKRAPRNPSSDYGFLGKPEEKRKKSNISGQVHNEGRKVKSGSYVEIRIT